MSKMISVLGLALPLAILSAPQVAAQDTEDTCIIMGMETAASSDEPCPSDLHTELSNLRIEQVMTKTNSVTGEEEEVTEVHTFNTFLELADKTEFGEYLRGGTPQKMHGEGVDEGIMTVFAVSDLMLGEEGTARLTELSMSQDPEDAAKLRHYVGAHIVPVPESRSSMWNGLGTRRTLAGAGTDVTYKTVTGGRTINGVGIWQHDVMATNGIIQVMSEEIVSRPAL